MTMYSIRFRSEGWLFVRSMLSASAYFSEQGSNPLAGRGLMHRSAAPVADGRPGAAFEQQADNTGLLFPRLCRTAPFSPGRLNRKVQRG
jgi:hypothetical protein